MTHLAPSRLKTTRVVARRPQKPTAYLASAVKLLGLVICAVLMAIPAVSAAPDPATVSFSLDFPASDPEHYSISVSSDGHGRYECSARTAQDSDDRETYQTEFDVTPANRARIFELAAQAHYFAKRVDSGNSKLAFTGSKKLIYQDGRDTHSAEYNYSKLPAVQQLTSFFQSLALTLDYGRRLAYYHRYQKLALDEELKRMEMQAKSNELVELQTVQPVLKQLYEDASVMNVVRARAERLMEMAKNEAAHR
jgi:hypothetical protein